MHDALKVLLLYYKTLKEQIFKSQAKKLIINTKFRMMYINKSTL